MTLEDIKKMQELRASAKAFSCEEMPVGMTIVTDDKQNKAIITGLNQGKIMLSNPVLGGIDSLTPKQLLDDWLFETPQGIMVCGVPDDSGIVKPSDAGFQLV